MSSWRDRLQTLLSGASRREEPEVTSGPCDGKPDGEFDGSAVEGLPESRLYEDSGEVHPQHAHVVLMGFGDDVVERVSHLGFTTERGTYGAVHSVGRSSDLLCVPRSWSIPEGFAEGDIFFVNLADVRTDSSGTFPVPPLGVKEFYCSASNGIIDARSIAMFLVEDDLERALQRGGVLVVFGGLVTTSGYITAEASRHSLQHRNPLRFSGWPVGFVRGLQSFRILERTGRRASLTSGEGRFGAFHRVLKEHYASAELPYECVYSLSKHPCAPPRLVHGFGDMSDMPEPHVLATNRDDDVVSFVIDGGPGTGLVIALPQTEDKAGLVASMLLTVLPTLRPDLFASPDSWSGRSDYWPAEAREIEAEKARVQEEAEARIRELDQALADMKEGVRYYNHLLTATDEQLVAAVVRCLSEDFGLADVVNVDHVQEFVAEHGPREDVWIRDRSPILLTEIKGIHGTPKEDDALQVQKYLFPRSQQWNRHDLQGLFIVNHQRGIEPRHRQWEIFQPDVLANAERYKIALLTTWDMFVLAQGRRRWGWPAKWLADLLYVAGRVRAVPSGYRLLGTIEQVWKRHAAFAVQELSGEVGVGTELAVVVDTEFYQWQAEALMIDGVASERAVVGQVPSFVFPFDVRLLRVGMDVFVVKREVRD